MEYSLRRMRDLPTPLAALARAGAFGAAIAPAQEVDVETVDAQEAREEAGGFWPAIRSAMRFMMVPFHSRSPSTWRSYCFSSLPCMNSAGAS